MGDESCHDRAELEAIPSTTSPPSCPTAETTQSPKPKPPRKTKVHAEAAPTTPPPPDSLSNKEQNAIGSGGLFDWMRSKDSAEVGALWADIILRGLATAAFVGIAYVWLKIVGEVLCKQADGQTKLGDAVLVTMLVTTTANVLGLLYFVAAYLFPKTKSAMTKADLAPPIISVENQRPLK